MSAVSSSSPRKLPRPSGRIGRVVAAHPRTIDAILVGLLVAIWLLAIAQDDHALPGTVGSNADGSYQVWIVVVRYLTAVISCTALLFRRKHPIIVFAVVAAIGVFSLTYGWAGIAATAIAVYSLGAHQSDRAVRAARIAQLAFAALAVVVLVYGFSGQPQVLGGPGNTLFVLVVLFAILAVGISIRERRLYVSALLSHAESLEREQEQSAKLAVADEREHIAREMHDVIAHGLTVMVRLADGARSRLGGTREFADVSRAVEHIADTGRRSLSDTRRMLSVLGDEDASREPQPTVEQIPALVDDFLHAGLPVTVQRKGTPPSSPGIQLAVYRTVQEALTNALKHADSPTAVNVDMDFTTGCAITVTDNGRLHPTGDAVEPGRGLAGMRQRAAIFGGEAIAGPTGSGWSIRFTLPPQEGDGA
ncbi:sensor histidine kinase [Paramicrobacterium fandaimingii]|uniref:sensor histidine kinase n=1 Tax=Paramicrobacterium fandaimingii TaxID=2708079 RepID=UPI0014200971|nr:histidine kinase [Microbacterium fandaimingii]